MNGMIYIILACVYCIHTYMYKFKDGFIITFRSIPVNLSLDL